MADRDDEPTPLFLLDQVRANDSEAWHRLVKLYRPLVLFWCMRGGVSAADAEDVSQEVFAAAAAGLGRFHLDQAGDTFRGWLRGITRNHVLLHFRRNKGRPQAEGGSDHWALLHNVADPLSGPAEREEGEVSALYRRALALLRDHFEERTWQAFWLTVVEGRAPANLTKELGMSPATIRQAKSRVLRRLRQDLGDLIG
jgi:RNA polymerase sigma-70 factor (ECF subfamily)